MSKHTPGPWRISKFENTTATRMVMGADNFAVTCVMERLSTPEENIANARLIASAPDLLAALQMQIDWRMRDGSPCACPAGQDEDEQRGKMPTIHATSCDELRAAIAKATGKPGC